VIDVLSEKFTVTAFFYNPNIQPPEEYDRRLLEVRRYSALRDIDLIIAEDASDIWNLQVRGLEQEPEGGSRCEQCFALRLQKTAATAAEKGFSSFTTTLTISPHKDSMRINRIGMLAGKKAGITYLARDFKQDNGYSISCDLSRQYGLYRQKYCGCLFSKRKRTRDGKERRKKSI
jgi:hypothetical protein